MEGLGPVLFEDHDNNSDDRTKKEIAQPNKKIQNQAEKLSN